MSTDRPSFGKAAMFKLLGRDLRTALIAFITASVVAAPAATAAVVYATNSDKVDNKHAVGASASKTNRAGKLVATNSTGDKYIEPRLSFMLLPSAGSLS